MEAMDHLLPVRLLIELAAAAFPVLEVSPLSDFPLFSIGGDAITLPSPPLVRATWYFLLGLRLQTHSRPCKTNFKGLDDVDSTVRLCSLPAAWESRCWSSLLNWQLLHLQSLSRTRCHCVLPGCRI
jgi:hypothetical protein